MKDMPDFTAVLLPRAPDAPEYRATIRAFRQWAGPHVHLGEAGVFLPNKDGYLLLFDLFLDRLEALGVTLGEMYGSTLSYTAGSEASLTERAQTLQMHMRIDPSEDVWITGMSVVEQERGNPARWCWQLTHQAYDLTVATSLDQNGVKHDTDTNALAESVAAEGARLAALARDSTETQ